MKVKARFFAVYRQIVGQDVAEVDLPDGASVSDLWEGLAKKHPQIQELLNVTAFAVNKEYVPWNTILNEGDEVVFVPPVSGGQGCLR
ncbi:MAG: molybdopterin converting factor subunit 1 [Chloroflexi bacterium]|nr:molybdopterin converting factor subunit 1 [Chloroflexota bacterium]